MHNPEDEQIALDAKCPNTPDMFCNECGADKASITHQGKKHPIADKCITDDFPKQIDQREEVIPDD